MFSFEPNHPTLPGQPMYKKHSSIWCVKPKTYKKPYVFWSLKPQAGRAPPGHRRPWQHNDLKKTIKNRGFWHFTALTYEKHNVF